MDRIPNRKAFDLEMGLSPSDYEDADQVVEAMLRDEPGTVIAAILTAGAVLKKVSANTTGVTCDVRVVGRPPKVFKAPDAETDPITSSLDQTRFGEEFRFGVTRGPSLGADEAKEFTSKTNASLQQIGGPVFGFEHGRLAEGLETLADRDLRESVDCRDVRRASEDAWTLKGSSGEYDSLSVQRCNYDGWVEDRQKLGNSLVHFSEKLLFIANNDLLLAQKRSDKPANAGQFVGAGQVSYNGSTEEDLNEQERRPYVLVLQAVGNSILNQLDELRARRNHEGALGLRAKVELETLKRTFSPPPSQVLDELVVQLQASADTEKQIAADKRAQMERLNNVALGADLTSTQGELARATARSTAATSDLNTIRDQAKPIVLTYNTLTGGDDPQSVNDLTSLKSAVVTSKTDVDGPNLVNDIVAWLDGQVKSYDSSFQSDPRPARLAAARDYLKGHRDTMGPADTHPREEVFQALAANISNNKAAADAAVAAKQKAADAVSSEVTIRTAAVESAQNALNAAKTDATSAGTESKEAEKLQGQYQNAIKAIGDRKQSILLKFQDDPRPDPTAVYSEVQTALQKDKPAGGCRDGAIPNKPATGTDATTARKAPAANTRAADRPASAAAPGPEVCDAITAMKNRNPPMAADGVYLGDISNTENAEDVLDRLISALQYQQIRVKQSDPTGTAAKAFQQAIDSAYEYRSGMAYLRPAGAYLRNSYPATSLQGDPGLGWVNRLGQQARRTIPLFDQFLATTGQKDLKIQSEIDKQFWQNINSVRVAGAGKTNYVLAKDDIGNWYIKAYSADPKPIIDAATSLAKFSLGANVPASTQKLSMNGSGTAAVTGSSQATPGGTTATTPLGIPATTTGAQSSAQSTPAKQQPPQPPLEKLLTLNKTKYDTQTQSEYDHLRNDLSPSQIKAAVTAAWTADKNRFPNGVPAPLAQALNASALVLDTTWKQLTDSKRSDEEASRILTALNSLLTFRSALNQKIASSLTDADQIKGAQQDVDQVIGAMLNHETSTRQATVKNYGTAIGFLGEALNP